MANHILIGLDQMEASVVRRRLRPWSKTDEQAIMPLVGFLHQRQYLPNVDVAEPRYETNVYPLYYYWAHHRQLSHREVYDRVFRSLPTQKVSMPEERLRRHVARVVDSEIDLLVEDLKYFVFIEAKEAIPGRKIKFEKQGGVHQLVRQYVQGRILETLVGKQFALATIGANNAQPITIPLNETDQVLLRLVGEERQLLEIPDLAWTA